MAPDKIPDSHDPKLAKAHRADMPDISGGSNGNDVTVQMRRAQVPPTPDQALWTAIRLSTNGLSYANYEKFLEEVMCFDDEAEGSTEAAGASLKKTVDRKERLRATRSLPFPDVEPYRLLKVATEVFLMTHCGVLIEPPGGGTDGSSAPPFDPLPTLNDGTPEMDRERSRYYRPTLNKDDIVREWLRYRVEVGEERDPKGDPADPGVFTLPYLAIIRRKLGDVPIRSFERAALDQEWFELCYGILRTKLTKPCFLELIWSYWHEEGMLVQTLNAISQRFQNVRGAGTNVLAQLEISPLRPLNNLLWGYLQDEQHRLTVRRRVYEYDHHYGLALWGKAVPDTQPADTRSKFIEGFHTLLQLTAQFYKQDDDTTVVADGFPVLNALKEVHLVLSEGAHNQYGDLPWTARMEMLMQQWLLARPEFREFLPTRIMVAYPEPWMDRVDGMKKLQSWTDTSVLHFRNLGIFGEQILLSIRFGAWSDVNDPAQAANWGRYWRPEVQGYIHAYRAATGVDLTDTSDTTQQLRYVAPSVHLRNRLAGQRAGLAGPDPASLQAPRTRPSPSAHGRALPSAKPSAEW
jgi:hypothetical protein